MHIETIRLAFLQVMAYPIAAPSPISAPQSGDNTGLLMLVATFISQVKVSGVASFLIQRIKKSEAPVFGWIGKNTPWVTRLVALGAAAATHLGIHWTFTPPVDGHTGTLLITGLSLTAIVTAAWGIAQNYLMQHAWYKTVFSEYLRVNDGPPLSTAPPASVTK